MEKENHTDRNVEIVENAGIQPALSRDGQHLNPQPSNDPADPLNWPMALKVGVLAQVCLLAALGTLNTAIINPAYVPMAKEFHITTVRASYQTTVVIALNGVGPFLWIPLANKYGRRPIYLFTTLLGFCSALGCAFTKNYSQLLVARVFNGFFPSAMALGAVTVADLFFFHQRGRAMGCFTVMMTNGGHLAPIIGGLLGQYLGWRWIFKFASILNAVMLVTIFFGLPETLYLRSRTNLRTADKPLDDVHLNKKTYINRLALWSNHPELHLKANQFVLPAFKMARYPSVLFPCLYYAAQYGFASILPAVTVAHIFSARFHWDTLQIGLGYGGSLTIGGCLGELAAGMVVDAIVKRERRRLGGVDPPPEARLKAIWTGEILVPAGLLIYGFCIQYKEAHWMGALMGMGIGCFGIQVITTTCYTYAIDCYRIESSEVSTLFNFVRQEIGMTFAFYAILLADRIGFQWEFVFFACMGSILAFLPIIFLMFKGQEVREKIGKPRNVNVFDQMVDEEEPGDVVDGEKI